MAKRNPMAHELLRNTLFRTKIVPKRAGKGSYVRKPKHKVERSSYE